MNVTRKISLRTLSKNSSSAAVISARSVESKSALQLSGTVASGGSNSILSSPAALKETILGLISLSSSSTSASWFGFCYKGSIEYLWLKLGTRCMSVSMKDVSKCFFMICSVCH